MALAIVLLPASLQSEGFAGRSLADHFTWVCDQVGLPTETVEPEAVPSRPDPAVVLDGRYPALAPGSVHVLAETLGSGGGVLLAPHGEVMAAAIPNPMPGVPLIEQLESAVGQVEAVASPHEATSIQEAPPLAEQVVRRRWVDTLAASGVRFVDPQRVVLDTTVTIGAGSRIWPDTVLRGDTQIATEVEVQSGAWLEDTLVERGAVIKPHSVCTRARIGEAATVGPFAHLRPGANLGTDTRVGNFVEVKKATLRQGAKCSHLAYIGDAEVGEDANVGAGTITCNYDGFGKYRTEIGARAFIGSNSSLVAPVKVGDNAIVGAGSVVARDVPADALYVERAEARLLEGKARHVRARNRARAEASEE
jgi:carbonic anhydrase/acetyltransferase-like protein (isoleucine patch superfamily)